MLRVGFDRLSAGLFTINSLYHYLKNISVSRLEFYAHHRLLLIYLLPLPFFSFFPSFYFIFVYRFRQLAVYSSTSNYKFYHYTAVRGSGSISETHVEKHHDVISRWYIKHISHHESNSNLWRSTQYIFFFKHRFLSFILSSKFFRDCRRWIQQFYLKKNLRFENGSFNNAKIDFDLEKYYLRVREMIEEYRSADSSSTPRL